LRCALVEVGDQGCGDFIRKWYDKRCADLGAHYTKHSGPPLDVVNRQARDLAPAETIGGDQEQQSVIPRAFYRGAINAAKQRNHIVPTKCANELFSAVMPRRLKAPIEADWDLAGRGQESQKGPHNGGDLLHRDPAHAGTGLDNERFQVADLDMRQALQVVVVFEETQKVAGEDPMSSNGGSGKSAHPRQVFAIRIDQPL
jgi:hypothetical protein